MTTTTKKHVFRAPNGVEVEIAPGPLAPFSKEKFIKERDEWLSRNRKYLIGYSVEQFLKEKHEDVEKGLL